MKILHILRSLMLVLSCLMFVHCTSEYTPIPGPPGSDGVDGVDGSAAVCIDCHSDSHREPIEEAWSLSRHAIGETWAARGTIASCARCHNNEGFIDVLSGFYFDENGINTANPDGYTVGNPISCTGCHTNHRSFDFENDGNDYALRTIEAVDLFLDPMVQIDLSNEVDVLGRSNICIHCHQPRNSYAIPTGMEDYEITSKRFGPHHGPQSTILEGIMAVDIPGTEPYPAVASSTHRTAASCTTCHMGETTDGLDGSHTFRPTLNACAQCHPNGAPEEASGFSEDMATLESLLASYNMFDEDGYYNEGIYPAILAQAAWNYRTLLEDQSRGIHNPAYVKALLKNTIEALQE